MLVHAHPDDESISTGGVMMKAKSHGHRVVNVTATRGEAGEIYNMDEAQSRPRLGEIRTEELKAADEVLGVDRQEFLGYRDSGMVDTADNKDPHSFHQAKLEEAAGKLAVFMREERPDVVVMDQRMPNTTGLEAARRILAEDPNQTVIVLTAFPDKHVQAAADRLGVRGWMSKNDMRLLPALLRTIHRRADI